MVGDHPLARGLEHPGSAVVAEPCPTREHGLFARLSQGCQSRIASEERLVVRNDSLDPGLLEHNLRDPDAVRIPRQPPRQGAVVRPVPRQQAGS